VKDKTATQVYICGAPEMVNDIKKLALETWGLPKANVHAEGYI
jgi:ferredoxin-NADP reductase